MAFILKELSVMTYGNGFTLWHYKSDDIESAVSSEGYFNPAEHMLLKGDLVIADVKTGKGRTIKFYFITGKKGSNLTTSRIL